MTKPIAATANVTLMEEGEPRLTDPVSKYVPEFKSLQVAVVVEPRPGQTAAAGGPAFYTVPAAREITIRDLLTHMPGVQRSNRDTDRDFENAIMQSIVD